MFLAIFWELFSAHMNMLDKVDHGTKHIFQLAFSMSKMHEFRVPTQLFFCSTQLSLIFDCVSSVFKRK